MRRRRLGSVDMAFTKLHVGFKIDNVSSIGRNKTESSTCHRMIALFFFKKENLKKKSLTRWRVHICYCSKLAPLPSVSHSIVFSIFSLSLSLSLVFYAESKGTTSLVRSFYCFTLNFALHCWIFFLYSNNSCFADLFGITFLFSLLLFSLSENWMICDDVLLFFKIWDSHSFRIFA